MKKNFSRLWLPSYFTKTLWNSQIIDDIESSLILFIEDFKGFVEALLKFNICPTLFNLSNLIQFCIICLFFLNLVYSCVISSNFVHFCPISFAKEGVLTGNIKYRATWIRATRRESHWYYIIEGKHYIYEVERYTYVVKCGRTIQRICYWGDRSKRGITVYSKIKRNQAIVWVSLSGKAITLFSHGSEFLDEGDQHSSDRGQARKHIKLLPSNNTRRLTIH